MLQNRLFFALASRSGFGATISDAVARRSIAFCNWVSADRIVMAASRLLRAVAAFVILLSFAAGLRKSYWSGCMRAATVICQQIFSILASVIFLLFKNPFKKCFKIVLHNNSTWLDDKESDDEVLRRQYRHLWEAVRSFQPEFVDAEMKRRQGLAAEVSTLVWLPRAGCALLWTASGCELLCFSSFAFHLTLRTAECLCHLVLVSVCVVTNRTKNHDRIAYMWKKHAVVGAGKCKVSLRSAQCFMQHGLDFCSLLKVWFSGPFPFSDIRPQAGWDGMFRVYLTSVEWDGWLGIYNLDEEVRFVFLGP